MAEPFGMPDTGYDATGQNAYAEIVAAPSGNRTYYNLEAGCETNAAVLSLDGGTTDHLTVPTTGKIAIHGVPISGEIHAKNLTTDSNYAKLWVNVW